jgi:hypothetical protein
MTTRPAAETQGRARSLRRFAWVIALVAVFISANAAPALVDVGWSPALVAGLAFYLGLVAGCAWQALHQVDFVDRFFNWSLLLAAAMVIPLFTGGDFEGMEGAWTIPGLAVGVVLAEGWMRQKRRP